MMINKARMLVGTLLAWVGFKIMPAPMDNIATLMWIPRNILREQEKGRTYGVVMIPWGELLPSVRMRIAAMATLASTRSHIENEIRIEEESK